MTRGALKGGHAPGSRGHSMVGLIPLLFLGACASPGPPRPPSLNLPGIVTSLTAERVGDLVQLHWVTPETTTDGLDMRGPMSAVICRRPAPLPVQDCAVVLQLPVVAGASVAVDHLPSTVITGPVVVVEYGLQILNAGGHSAGESAPALVASGPAPASPQGLQVKADQEGAVLMWRDTDAQGVVELHRTTAVSAKPTAQQVPGEKKGDTTEVVLRVPAGKGALDRTAKMGEGYTYTAQRVQTVTLEGKSLEVRSAVAGPVTVEMRDVFPPRRPVGLEAIAANDAVDLSWEPNPEPDLEGYWVLRQDGDSPQQLNAKLLSGPSFRDKTAVCGHTYRYTVVAVDRAGNRSAASDPAQVSVRGKVN